MKIGLRILLGYFVIVAVAGFLLMRVFVQEVKPRSPGTRSSGAGFRPSWPPG